MRKLLKGIFLPLLGAGLLAPAAFGQIEQAVETFESYSPPHNAGGFWNNPWVITGTTANWELIDEGENISLWTDDGNLELLTNVANPGYSEGPLVGTDEEPLVFSFRFYDYMTESAPDTLATGVVYGELRAQFSRLFAAGFINTAADGSYQGRVTDRPASDGPAIFPLNTPRSLGWHEFKFVIFTQHVDIYVDGVLDIGGIAYNNGNLGMDRIRMGGNFSTAGMPARFDDVYAAHDSSYAPEIVITEQPQTVVRSFGESVEFTVAATGGTEPYTYQWTRDGEPLVDDARISGATTPTLTITNLDGPDSGAIRAIVTGADSFSAESATANLYALVEHEVIVNALDLTYPGEFFEGTWGVNSETAGWFGWMSASTANVLNAEGNPNPERTATFQPTITETGWYEVQTYFVPSYDGPLDNRTNEAPYHVHHTGGEDLVFINQQNPLGPAGEQWVTVGTYQFEAGTAGKVVISNLRKGPSGDGGENGTRGSLVIADAVRWIPTEAPPSAPPAITITRAEGSAVELMIVGDPDTEYTVQSVANLGDEWVVLGTETTDPSGAAIFTDSEATINSRRFYRVVIE